MMSFNKAHIHRSVPFTSLHTFSAGHCTSFIYVPSQLQNLLDYSALQQFQR